ncbi:MAG TPA: NAD(P)/FAD-dependent oxidoreductase [Myxococcota bacterium]
MRVHRVMLTSSTLYVTIGYMEATMNTLETDVVIVGASIAGTTAATLFARAGLRVTVVERAASPEAFKRQCTHFLQASATPVLEKLGVIDDIEAAGAVKNGLQVWTKDGGWLRISLDGERDEVGRRHGYTLRREKLDPILRAHATRTAGVTMKLGASVVSLLEEAGRVVGIEIDEAGARTVIRAQLVVGADGRRSTVAELARMEPEIRPHYRAGFMVYMRNVGMPTGSDAQFWILGEDICYAFPSDDGLTLLAHMVHEDRLDDFKKDREGTMRAAFASLDNAPDLSRAEIVGGFIGAANTPNTYRYPTKPGLVLVGDAAMASDYIWGVGCGFALQGADMLVTHAAPALQNRSAGGVDQALAAYARQHASTLYAQHKTNTAFSASDTLPFLLRAIFTYAPRDQKLRELVGLSGAGRISQRDLRIPLRLALVMLTSLLTSPLRALRARTPRPTLVAAAVSR